VIGHPQTAALGIVQELDGVRTVGLPLSFDGQRAAWTRKAPKLGEHGDGS